MNTAQVDFAVFGSSPLAGVIAGLLASRHGRRVALVGDVVARHRLPRSLDLSVAPITRPETWSILSGAQADINKVLVQIGGRHALRRVNPVFFADGRAAKEALGHFAHMARANGLILEPAMSAKRGGGRSAWRINDAVTLNRLAFEPSLDTWLGHLGVMRFARRFATINADGMVAIAAEGQVVEAARAILVDADAILHDLDRQQWPAMLCPRPSATILTSSNRHLTGPIMVGLDTGTTLIQHEEGGMAAMGPGTLGALSTRLATLVGDTGQPQQVGQVAYQTLATSDGAPLIGEASKAGPIILAGLGTVGVFIAPVLARWLAGAASNDEAKWCETHRPDRPDDTSVAEFTHVIRDLAP